MGELGGRQLCTFDPASGELYASVSSDNRLRIYNTVRRPAAAGAAFWRAVAHPADREIAGVAVRPHDTWSKDLTVPSNRLVDVGRRWKERTAVR